MGKAVVHYNQKGWVPCTSKGPSAWDHFARLRFKILKKNRIEDEGRKKVRKIRRTLVKQKTTKRGNDWIYSRSILSWTGGFRERQATDRTATENRPTIRTSRLRREPQEWPRIFVEKKCSKESRAICDVVCGNSIEREVAKMMLDNKSEQKWPLTAADYETGSQGSFLFVLIL